MIIATGIDIISIHRFALWHQYKKKQLQRIFSQNEIAYACSNKQKSAERFAARFSAKEAFFKAAATGNILQPMAFLTLCRYVCVKRKKSGAPYLAIAWRRLPLQPEHNYPPMTTHLSLSHSKTDAIALVVIEK